MLVKNKNEIFYVKPCETVLKKLIGLMFQLPKVDGAILMFNKEKFVSLHTFFMFIKIDIIYLDQNKVVKKIIKNVIPFTFYIPPVKCKYILELKNSKNLKINDKLIFKDF